MSPYQCVHLLCTAVASAVVWKVSAWPFQESMTQELDSLQCQMLSDRLPCGPSASEFIDVDEKKMLVMWHLRSAYGACCGLPALLHGMTTFCEVAQMISSAMTC